MEEASRVELLEKKVLGKAPDLEQTLGQLGEKLAPVLPEVASRPEFKGFQEDFKAACQRLKRLYQEGGVLGATDFVKCDLFEHSWRHIENDIVMVARILPGYLEESPGYTPEDVEDLFWATLLHDVGWLRTTEEEQEGTYRWGGEKFFVHCEDSVRKAEPILEGMVQEGLIKRTEFNPSPEQEQELKVDMENPRLGDVLRIADTLSYFCSPSQIPLGVQNLFKEAQAVARPDCLHIRDFVANNKKELAQKLGLSEDKDELIRRFEAGLLTIGDLKFPGQSVIEFVASEYLPMNLDTFEPWLKFVDEWYGGKPNEDRENYYLNVARVRAIQALANTSEGEIGGCPATVNPLCYLEGSLMGRDLREVATEKGLQTDVDWEAVDLRMLGVTEKNIFQRLVTQEIKALLLQASAGEKRKEVFTALVARFVKRHEFKNRLKGKERQDRFCLAVAPLAYEDLLSSQEIFDAFKEVNARAGKNTPLLAPVWTIRRDRDFPPRDRDFETYARRLEAIGVKKVVLAGKETEATLLEGYKELISRLTGAGIEVTILAGQVMQGERKDLGTRNVRTALEIASTNPLVQITGFQSGQKALEENLETARKLGQEGRLLVSLSSDLDTEGLATLIESVNEHPFRALADRGIKFKVSDPHDFYPSSEKIEAVLAVPLPHRVLLSNEPYKSATWDKLSKETYKPATRDEKILKYKNYYITEAERLIRH